MGLTVRLLCGQSPASRQQPGLGVWEGAACGFPGELAEELLSAHSHRSGQQTACRPLLPVPRRRTGHRTCDSLEAPETLGFLSLVEK